MRSFVKLCMTNDLLVVGLVLNHLGQGVDNRLVCFMLQIQGSQ